MSELGDTGAYLAREIVRIAEMAVGLILGREQPGVTIGHGDARGVKVGLEPVGLLHPERFEDVDPPAVGAKRRAGHALGDQAQQRVPQIAILGDGVLVPVYKAFICA